MSTFRFTRAEFIKIFKKPSAYIMAVFLLACIVVSYFIYTPQTRTTYLATYEINNDTSVATIYNQYNTSSSGDVRVVYESNFISAENIIDFYKHNTDRIEQLKDSYTNLTIRYNNMNKASQDFQNNLTDDTLLRKTIREYTDALYLFRTNVQSISTLQFYLVGATEFLDTDFYSNALTFLYDLYTYLDTTTDYDIVLDYFELNELNTTIDNIFTGIRDYQKTTINETVTKITDYKDTLVNYVNINTEPNICNEQRLILVEQLRLLSVYADLLIENEYSYPVVLIEKEKLDEFNQNYNAIMTTLKSDADKVLSTSDYKLMAQTFTNTTILEDMISSLQSIEYLSMDKDKVTQLENYYKDKIVVLNNKIVNELNELKNDIEFFNSKNSQDIEKIITTISKQKNLSVNTKDLINAEINDYFLKDIPNDDISKLYGYDLVSFNKYENEEKITKIRYLIDNEKYGFEYNEVFSNDYTSGTKESAFDFTFFVMSLSTVFVTMFAIFMISNLIATENDNGTIKMILTRPYKRYKIITGKMLATLFFACVFMLFTMIVTFCAGWGLYGVDMTNILAVFSANSAFAINPLLLLFIYLICCILKIAFFIVLATMITVLCKSFPLSIIVNFITYAVIFILNILLGGYGWYAFVPFGELMLFNYFGGAFRVFGNKNFISMLVSSPFVGQVAWWLSLTISFVSMVIMLAVTYRTFNKRDF